MDMSPIYRECVRLQGGRCGEAYRLLLSEPIFCVPNLYFPYDALLYCDFRTVCHPREVEGKKNREVRFPHCMNSADGTCQQEQISTHILPDTARHGAPIL